MNFRKTGFRINNIENVKPHYIKLDKEYIKEIFDKKKHKTANDYIKEYLIEKKLYQNFDKAWKEAIDKTLPKKVKENCLWCNGKSDDILEKKCSLFHNESQINYLFASQEFVTIIEQNRHILKDNQTIKRLTIKFFEGFLFQDGRVFYSTDAIIMECLKEGFLSISQFFSNNDELKNLEIINNSLHVINDEQLQIMLNGEDEPIHIKPQQLFFTNKLNYFKELRYLKTENSKNIEKVDGKLDTKENEYSRIFVNPAGLDKFKRLLVEFGNNKENLANYSYVYHRMVKDGLIYSDLPKIEFIFFLLNFEINIDRIKTFSQIGKKDYRESIYINA